MLFPWFSSEAGNYEFSVYMRKNEELAIRLLLLLLLLRLRSRTG